MVYYLDENNNIVDKEKATHVIIPEHDENGNLIGETFGMINTKKENTEVSYEAQSDFAKSILENYTDGEGQHIFRK